MKNDKIQTMVLSGLIGGAIGAGLALLMAPKSGKKLRRDITEMMDDLSGDMRSLVKHAKRSGSNLIHDGIESGEDMFVSKYNKVKKLVSELTEHVNGSDA